MCDFEEQLRLEEAAKSVAPSPEEENVEKSKTKVDDDGTVMEWDEEKKAWFPKIDEDFLANYHQNYGEQTSESTDKAAAYWHYYNFYYDQYKTKEDGSDYTEEERKHYADYYARYYSKWDNEGENPPISQPSDHKSSRMIGDVESADDIQKRWQQYQDFLKEERDWDPEDEEKGEKKVEKTEEEKKEEKKEAKKKRAMTKKEPPKWFDANTNTTVYVTGLSPDTTEEEFQELMSKYGLIMYDPHTRKPKLKLYRDDKGKVKGDGRCCYIKSESVDLCLRFLDGLVVRGHTLAVEEAKFELKGEYDPSLKKRKLTNKEKKKIKEQQEKLFAWKPDKMRGQREKHERIVVIKNAFDPKLFDTDPALITTVRATLRQECEKYGEVRKIVVYDRHPAGVCTVAYSDPETADGAIDALNGRFFGKRQATAETWDGREKFEIKESAAEETQRLKDWENYLQKDGNEDTKTAAKSSPADATSQPAAEQSTEDFSGNKTPEYMSGNSSGDEEEKEKEEEKREEGEEMT